MIMKSRRSYKQNCALADGLDLVGERWTLLIVRELMIGPRRFSLIFSDFDTARIPIASALTALYPKP